MPTEGAQGSVALPPTDTLYDEAACGLMVTSGDGTIRRINRTLCRWIGREPEPLIGKAKFQDLLTIGGRIFHQTHWAPLLQIQGSVAEVKLEVVHSDGQKLPMVLNAVRRVHDGVTLHELAIYLAEDRNKYERELMTARHRAEELLANERQAQHALKVTQEELDRQRAMAEDRALFAEQMVGIVSHDLRNPLSVIRMSAHLLARGELSSGQLRALGRLTNSVSRADRLIVDLLDFTQARLGRGLQIERKPIDIHALVDECVQDMRLAFPGRALEHVSQGSGTCVASGDRIIQLVGNLVSNALSYGAPDTPIRVTSCIEAATFRISVHNEGKPIDQALQPRLFDPMTRGDSSAGTALGVGLGLFIVREIARAHDGQVSVESSAAAGTTFVAVLPRARDDP